MINYNYGMKREKIKYLISEKKKQKKGNQPYKFRNCMRKNTAVAQKPTHPDINALCSQLSGGGKM